MTMQNGFMSLKEAMHFLGVNQSEIETLVRTHKLHAYKFGGSYLRFKKDELLRLKHELEKEATKQEDTIVEVEIKKRTILNFIAYNNFYILSALLLVGLLYYLIQT